MCDRHHAQSRAIRSVYGKDVNVLYCAIHIARNIERNVGAKSMLRSLFWNMRFERTVEAERAFLDHIEGMRKSKASLFTSYLLNSLDSFLPSRIDHILRYDHYPALSKLKTLSTQSFCFDSEPKKRAMTLLFKLNSIGTFYEDVFKRDNTNTIESYFNVIKGRIPQSSPRLVDVFAAINFTESATLAHKNPMSPDVPKAIIACLSDVVMQNVLIVMTKKGIQTFLDVIVNAASMILSDENSPDDPITRNVKTHIGEGTIIKTFGWMPPDWVIPREKQKTEHNIRCVETDEPPAVEDIIEFLEPYISNANRSVPVFCALDNALVTL